MHDNGNIFPSYEAWCAIGCSLARRLVAHLLHRFLHLLRADIPDMGADRPLMTERVFQLAIAIAPEHVVQRHRDFRARAHRLFEDGVRVLDIEMDDDRRALEMFRTEGRPTPASRR